MFSSEHFITAFPVRMKTAKISTGELAYIDRGSGAPVLLVHGFPLDHTMWDSQIETLSQHSRVLAPDLRGFGKSPLGPLDATGGISMERYADDLAEFLEALSIGPDQPVIFVGLSMGGYIAWQFVRKYVSRLRGLALLDTRSLADTDEARAGRIKMAENVAEWGSARVAEMMGPKLVAAAVYKANSQVITDLRRVVTNTSPAAIAAAQRGLAARPDMTSFLPKIDVPALVVVGIEDAISPPAEMQAIAGAIPGAEYVVIPDSGHMTTMENPAAVNAALSRFIATVDSR
jgi:pimeloyl-ACP methyl ester carboxylesterase